MKIAIIGTGEPGGGNKRIKSYSDFLKYKNHDVKVIAIPDDSYYSKIWFYYGLAYGKLVKNSLRIMDKISQKIENKIKKEKYDVIITVETKYSKILTKDLDCIKIFSCQSLEADERYFSKKYDLKEVLRFREAEIEIMKNSDFVIFPWKTSEEYVRRHIWDGNNFVSIKTCCYPKDRKVSYFYPVSIISLGNLKHYWSNKELLSFLTRISPYVIDVYGKYKPERKHNINFKGYARSLDVFYNYQFGLNTISKDPFRQNHFSSRIISYLAYGLPVLFPEWQKYPNELRGCVPYNEDNFLDVVEKYSEQDQWEKLSEDSAKQGMELNWIKTMEPLEKLLKR